MTKPIPIRTRSGRGQYVCSLFSMVRPPRGAGTRRHGSPITCTGGEARRARGRANVRLRHGAGASSPRPSAPTVDRRKRPLSLEGPEEDVQGGEEEEGPGG